MSEVNLITKDDFMKVDTQFLLDMQANYRDLYRTRGPLHWIVNMLENILDELDRREKESKWKKS